MRYDVDVGRVCPAGRALRAEAMALFGPWWVRERGRQHGHSYPIERERAARVRSYAALLAAVHQALTVVTGAGRSVGRSCGEAQAH